MARFHRSTFKKKTEFLKWKIQFIVNFWEAQDKVTNVVHYTRKTHGWAANTRGVVNPFGNNTQSFVWMFEKQTDKHTKWMMGNYWFVFPFFSCRSLHAVRIYTLHLHFILVPFHPYRLLSITIFLGLKITGQRILHSSIK